MALSGIELSAVKGANAIAGGAVHGPKREAARATKSADFAATLGAALGGGAKTGALRDHRQPDARPEPKHGSRQAAKAALQEIQTAAKLADHDDDSKPAEASDDDAVAKIEDEAQRDDQQQLQAQDPSAMPIGLVSAAIQISPVAMIGEAAMDQLTKAITGESAAPGAETAEATPMQPDPAKIDKPPGSGPGNTGQGPPKGPDLGPHGGSITQVDSMDGVTTESHPEGPGPKVQPLELADLNVAKAVPVDEPKQAGDQTNANALAAQAAPATQGADAPAGADGPKPLERAIVDHIEKAAKGGIQSIKLILHPEHLGEVQVRVSVVNGVINAHVKVDNPEVQNAITRQLEGLRQAIADQGLKIDRLEVNVSGDPNQQANSGFQGGDAQRQGAESKPDPAFFGRYLAGTPVVEGEVEAAGADLRQAPVSGGLDIRA